MDENKVSEQESGLKINRDQFAMMNASVLTAAFFALNAQMTAQNSGVEPDPDEIWERIFEVQKKCYYRLIDYF